MRLRRSWPAALSLLRMSLIVSDCKSSVTRTACALTLFSINRVVPEDEVLPVAIDMANQTVASAISAGRAALGSGHPGELPERALDVIRTMKRKLVESRNLGEVDNPARL